MLKAGAGSRPYLTTSASRGFAVATTLMFLIGLMMFSEDNLGFYEMTSD
jgi:hypothetical protein